MHRFFSILVFCSASQLTFGQDSKSVLPAFESVAELPNMRDFTVSTDGKEAYCTLSSPLEDIAVIVRVKKKNGRWKLDKISSFSGKFRDLEPFLSPDNLRLYFASNRPLNASSNEPKDFDLWYVERSNVNAPWGNPTNLGTPINTDADEFYPSLADNKNLYFTSNRAGSKGKDDLFFSQFDSNQYSEPISLSDSINSDGYEFNGYIDPSEKYLIYTAYARKDGFGSGDLYISYRSEDGVWSKAINMGSEVNSASMDYCPLVDHSSGLFYFTSKRSSFEATNDFQSVDQLQEELSKSQNGMSRLYTIEIQKVTLLPQTIIETIDTEQSKK